MIDWSLPAEWIWEQPLRRRRWRRWCRSRFWRRRRAFGALHPPQSPEFPLRPPLLLSCLFHQTNSVSFYAMHLHGPVSNFKKKIYRERLDIINFSFLHRVDRFARYKSLDQILSVTTWLLWNALKTKNTFNFSSCKSVTNLRCIQKTKKYCRFVWAVCFIAPDTSCTESR